MPHTRAYLSLRGLECRSDSWIAATLEALTVVPAAGRNRLQRSYHTDVPPTHVTLGYLRPAWLGKRLNYRPGQLLRTWEGVSGVKPSDVSFGKLSLGEGIAACQAMEDQCRLVHGHSQVYHFPCF